MAVDIGIDAVDLDSFITYENTHVNKSHPAEIAGLITTVEIWAFISLENCRVGTFYTINGNTLKCRDSVAIGAVASGAKRTFPGLSIAVEVGDYIGTYSTAGYIESTLTGYAGHWYKAGENIDPGDEAVYTFNASWAVSLGGYITVAGWTGKISGVTNPAKIMGVDVANIKSVKGVE